MDWNEYKNFLEKKINIETGLNAEIRGDIKIKILPNPTLLINDVRVANIEGAAAPDILSVESFEIRVALTPLLGRQLQFSKVKLVKPVLNLEVLADGRTNMASQKLLASDVIQRNTEKVYDKITKLWTF